MVRISKADFKKRWRSVVGWVAIVAGGVIIVAGWFGVSGETIVAKQLPYLISGGIGGLVLVGGGVGLLIAEDLRAERDRVGRLEAELLEVRDLLRTLLDRGRSKVS